MVKVTRELAERIADLARLLVDDDSSDAALRQLSDLVVELIPGCTAAGVVAAGDSSWTFGASDPAVADLHRLQLTSGEGPIAEALRHGEPRRIDDTVAESRWPDVCAAAAEAGFASCLSLPLRTDRNPGGVLAIYAGEPDAFTGSRHDLALLIAAQGGVAFRNAKLYGSCRKLVENLYAALESRAVIEQAKGILVGEYGCTPDEAFKRLSALSQNSNRKVREISADLVGGRISPHRFGSTAG